MGKPIKVSLLIKSASMTTRYVLLAILGFVYLYPMFFMISTSLMDMADLVNPTIYWIPSKFYLDNFKIAFRVLDFKSSFINSLLMSIIPALLQTASSMLVGYGFARFNFPLKNFWLILLIGAFIIPTQITLVPKYIMFNNYRIINTPLSSFLPAMLGQGIKSTLFILIFYQFFKTYPKAIDEAAQIDGANKWQIFYMMAVPIGVPAIVVSLIFSFVWYWNETYLSSFYFGKTIQTLPMKLQSFVDSYNRLYPTMDGSVVNRLNESIRMAGTLVTILPLIIVYLFLQRQFIESIEKTGITGE